MDAERIEPQTVTKPIQLLAAWLIGLISVNSTFLLAATHLQGWLSSALVIASIVNVPVFLVALFVLQTRFRPELQEDAFYSQYLDSKTNQVVLKPRWEAIESELANIKSVLLDSPKLQDARVVVDIDQVPELARFNVGLNASLKNFKELRETMKAKKIPLSDTFGSGVAPEEGVFVAIDKRMPFAASIEAIRLAVECGLDGYGYFDPVEEDSRENVLIGAYGLQDEHIPVSLELRDFLDSDPERIDLRAFEDSHRIRRNKKK